LSELPGLIKAFLHASRHTRLIFGTVLIAALLFGIALGGNAFSAAPRLNMMRVHARAVSEATKECKRRQHRVEFYPYYECVLPASADCYRISPGTRYNAFCTLDFVMADHRDPSGMSDVLCTAGAYYQGSGNYFRRTNRLRWDCHPLHQA
jgi:hypothetical protein